jgi:hypothetical protein
MNIVPRGKIRIYRKVLRYEDIPNWESSNKEICDVVLSQGGIEDNDFAKLHADFANKYTIHS